MHFSRKAKARLAPFQLKFPLMFLLTNREIKTLTTELSKSNELSITKQCDESSTEAERQLNSYCSEHAAVSQWI